MRLLRTLWLLPCILLTWLVCMGAACPQSGSTTPDPCEAPSISTTTLPDAIVGQNYTFVLTVDGDAVASDSIIAGTLPAGLDYDEKEFSGKPSEAGVFTFTVEVRNDCGTDTQAFTLTVGGSCPAFSLRTTALPVGGVGAFYLGDFRAMGGFDFEHITVVSGALPPGLQINGAQNVVGTPTTAGSFTFTIEARDECTPPQLITREYTITINAAGDCPPLNLDTTAFPDGETGTPYFQEVAYSGGLAKIDVLLAAGALPPGLELTLDKDIVGTPTTAGTFNFTLQVQDNCSTEQTAERAYTIVIAEGAGCADPPDLQITGLPSGLVGTPYDVGLSASSGEGTLTFSIVADNLPDGLSMTSAGDISGTPTLAGTFSFTVRVADSCVPQQTDTQTVSITIAPDGSGCTPLNLNPLTVPEGIIGNFYETFFGEWVSGGEGSKSFFVQAPTLPPPGLTLDQNTGTLSGTPTTFGEHQFILQVIDECVPVQSEAVVVTVNVI